MTRPYVQSEEMGLELVLVVVDLFKISTYL